MKKKNNFTKSLRTITKNELCKINGGADIGKNPPMSTCQLKNA
ncbi:hypothetical protein N474_24005 [Pseudoalteromonas luteoviolacea CPMOR-2]|nr:hypothetical protein [Pseudoalteromonas luteoviolacea]KZN51509.1 hypothetical protein N474_24005 [Pseudoalteromonas luteoviolacea CPMOR-2]